MGPGYRQQTPVSDGSLIAQADAMTCESGVELTMLEGAGLVQIRPSPVIDADLGTQLKGTLRRSGVRVEI